MDDLEMPTESPPVVAESSPAKVRDKQSRRGSSGRFGEKRQRRSSLSGGHEGKVVSRDHHRVIMHAAALSPNPRFKRFSMVHSRSDSVAFVDVIFVKQSRDLGQ